MFFLYEVLLYLVFVIGLPFFLIIGLVRGKYVVNFSERMGFYRSPARAHDLWIHAVSVGEALAAKTIVEGILRMRPETSIVFTTTTITGQAQARRLYPNATVTYFPFDFGFSVRRFLNHHSPKAFATMETELWPNVTRISRERGIRLLLANGRISDRSYPRYRFFRPVVARLLRSYERVLAREQLDRERFLAIGAHDVEVTGNVKFDYTPNDAPLPEIEALIAGRKCVVLGSTFEGEDEMLMPEVERLVRERNLFFVIAPRKPERFDAVAALLSKTGLNALRRSQWGGGGPAAADSSQDRGGEAAAAPLRPAPDILLLDTIGELARVYRYATVAFVGGSLVPHGGHNPIEPAAAGVPVCFGPHMTAFREVAAAFLKNDAAMEVTSPAGFARFIEEMTSDDSLRASYGERAKRVVAENRGASERTARRIVELLS
ncbi:MAG TPA: 3-deoxy-D-manno-octulosonic acid transferase [Thermoanaerobaculia bacterium]